MERKWNAPNRIKASKIPSGLSLVWTKFDVWILLKPANTQSNLVNISVQMQNEIYPSKMDKVVVVADSQKIPHIQPSAIKQILFPNMTYLTIIAHW